ncbi:hypothetical protein ES708_05334 [subsurface metagenome]
MTIRIAYNQLEGLIKMVKGKSGKKFKKEKKQKQKIEYSAIAENPKKSLSGKVRIRRKQGFSNRRF